MSIPCPEAQESGGLEKGFYWHFVMTADCLGPFEYSSEKSNRHGLNSKLRICTKC